MREDDVIIDYQSGAMAGVNSAIGTCQIIVIVAATFDQLTFAWPYDPTRTPLPDKTAIGSVAPDTVLVGVTFPASGYPIRGVKSYKLAGGTIIVEHRKN